MLPLSLLRASSSLPMLVELKTGETYNGRLVNCDAWMNLNLREVICTSRDGNQFWKLNECYIRGSSIKYLRLPEDAIDRVPDESEERQFKQSRIALNNQGGRAGGRGRGRGSGRGDGRGGRTGRAGGRGRGRSGGRGRGSSEGRGNAEGRAGSEGRGRSS